MHNDRYPYIDPRHPDDAHHGDVQMAGDWRRCVQCAVLRYHDSAIQAHAKNDSCCRCGTPVMSWEVWCV